MELNDFLIRLFGLFEATCFSKTPYGTQVEYVSVVTQASILNEYKKEDAFFSINPIDAAKTRADSSVVAYRNILVEMDKLALDLQDQYITEIGMPYTTAVYSGGKSIHYIISLQTDLDSETEYRALVKRVYKAVGNDIVDQANKNPSRFSRLPGHLRLDTGKEQKLLACKYLVPNEILETWLNDRGAPVEDTWEDIEGTKRYTSPNYRALYPNTKNFLMFGAKENWNMRLFKASADLCRCGYDEEGAKAELMRVTGTLDFNDLKTIGSAFKNESGRDK